MSPEPTAGTAHWSLTVDAARIAWLQLDRTDASTNTLGRPVLEELAIHLATVRAQAPRALVISSGKANGFIAGADIQEFTALKSAPQGYELVRAGQRVIDQIEALPCPTVALIHGFALGGGLELALACRYRIAADDGKVAIGLPEVQLGIHPGFGGTVRAPRLIGARKALELMLTGRTLKAPDALALGLVDRLAPPAELKAAAERLLTAAPRAHRPPLLDRVLALGPLRGFVAAALRKSVVSRASPAHYPAPYAIINLWQRFGAHGAAAYEAEAKSVAELFVSPTAANLIRVFFLQNRLKGLARTKAGVERVHVVGAGVMGGDIAAWCALRGLTVTLQDREQRLIDAALERATATFTKRLKAAAPVAAARERLRSDLEGTGLAQADLVIEAIAENAEAKRALYTALEPKLKPDAIIATNTSSLMLETLSGALSAPGRLVGLHFFNPISRMPLVEVVRGPATDDTVVARTIAFARQLDKLPLPCRSAPGFVVNRILFAYLTEAMRIAQEGVPLALIDQAAVAFGMPQGPAELADTIGLDVALSVGEVMCRAFGAPAVDFIRPLVSRGQLGRKTGQGLYRWVDGKAVKPDVGGAVPPADLEDRLILPLLNEAVACLREGIIEDADLLDAGVVFGTGFAPFRGGPLAYARSRGVPAILVRLGELTSTYGSRFQADQGWSLL